MCPVTLPIVAAPVPETPVTVRRLAQLKGRQPDEIALQEVRALIGVPPPDGQPRAMLIEYLHQLNDCYHGLFERHLVALASEMRLAPAEVYEVATFYHHFEVLRDGQLAPVVTVRVCDSQSCAMAGAADLLARLPTLLGPSVRVVAAPCLGRCEQAPAVMVGQRVLPQTDAAQVQQAVQQGLHVPGFGQAMMPTGHEPGVVIASEAWQSRHGLPRRFAPRIDEEGGGPGDADFIGFYAYRAQGGYARAAAVVNVEAAEDVLRCIEDSGLRGLGGAGFAAARKWRIVREQSAPRMLVVNLDEGEPGTFKDRTYLERDPHRFLEGMLIAAQVVGTETCVIYLRDEYHAARHMLAREIAALQSDPPCLLPQIELRRGAGAYVCGEESAMLESIEGKRGEPRLRPPYVAERGLFGRPTLVHNFETLYWLREILENGAAWFRGFGRQGRHGLRSFSVSGRVKQPGVKRAPAGISVQELIDEHCGGMQDGHTLYAYLPGGASGGILPARLSHLALDFDTLQPYGCFIGSAAIVVLSQHDRARDAALNAMRFFAAESCGQCTPCRVGTAKALQLMQAAVWDQATLDDLNAVMADASICGLGQAAPNPVRCVQKYFAHEIGG